MTSTDDIYNEVVDEGKGTGVKGIVVGVVIGIFSGVTFLLITSLGVIYMLIIRNRGE